VVVSERQPPALPALVAGLSEEEKARRRKDAIEDVSKDLLAVLNEYLT